MVNFEAGTLVKGAYVVINGVEYVVHMPQLSGDTPLSVENLNKMQTDIPNDLLIGRRIRLTKSSAQSISKNTKTQVAWNSEVYNNTNGKLTKSGNTIKIGTNVHNIMVIAKYQAEGLSFNKYIYIEKNSTSYSSMESTDGTIMTTAIIPVEENDVIDVKAYFENTASTITAGGESWNYFDIIILN